MYYLNMNSTTATVNDTFSSMDLDELQSYYSDFHKSFYGFRPRGAVESQWEDRNYLVEQINMIHIMIDVMKTTFSGREELRSNGWVAEETDPELAKQAEWLKSERELACEY